MTKIKIMHCMIHAHLNSGLAEVESHRQLLAGEHVRVLGFLKGLLKLVQLEGGEGGA